MNVALLWQEMHRVSILHESSDDAGSSDLVPLLQGACSDNAGSSDLSKNIFVLISDFFLVFFSLFFLAEDGVERHAHEERDEGRQEPQAGVQPEMQVNGQALRGEQAHDEEEDGKHVGQLVDGLHDFLLGRPCLAWPTRIEFKQKADQGQDPAEDEHAEDQEEHVQAQLLLRFHLFFPGQHFVEVLVRYLSGLH